MRKELFLSAFLISAIFFMGCGYQETKPQPPPDPGVTYNFNAAAAEGDLLTYSVNVTYHTYSYNNITHGSSGSGSYTINPDGTLKMLDDGGDYVGRGMLLINEAIGVVHLGSVPEPDTLIVGVPTLTASYGVQADGVYNFVNSFGEYGTFEIKTGTKTVSYVNLATTESGTETYTDEGTGLIKYTDQHGANNAMLLPGKILVVDQTERGEMIIGVVATTEYGPELPGRYTFIDNQGAHGSMEVFVDPVTGAITYEGAATYLGGATFTGTGSMLPNGSFLATQETVVLTDVLTNELNVIYLPGKVAAFNVRGNLSFLGFDNYLGFGMKL